MIGDLPEADAKPPTNMLFVCKLNPVRLLVDVLTRAGFRTSRACSNGSGSERPTHCTEQDRTDTCKICPAEPVPGQCAWIHDPSWFFSRKTRPRISQMLLTSAAMRPVDQVTTEEDLEIIFSRFGNITSCDIIRDYKTGGCTVCMQPNSLSQLHRRRSHCIESPQRGNKLRLLDLHPCWPSVYDPPSTSLQATAYAMRSLVSTATRRRRTPTSR